jgi:hypothetical protein
VATGTYLVGGDTVGTAATLVASSALFCGSGQKTLRTVIVNPGSAAAGTGAAVYNFDMTNYKLQAYVAHGTPGAAVLLLEGNTSLTETGLIIRYIAVCS